jgi:hypothetical protein
MSVSSGSLTLRRAVLGGYKRLMRAREVVFKEDARALLQSRVQLRTEFDKNRNLTEESEIEKLLKGVGEVEELLLCNVVQGKRNDRGNFEVKIEPEHTVQKHMRPAQDVAKEANQMQSGSVTVNKVKSGGRSGA